MHKNAARDQFARQRNEFLDQLYAIPDQIRSGKVQSLDLSWAKRPDALSQYVENTLLSEDTGIEVYESGLKIESISLITVHRAVQGVIQSLRKALADRNWLSLSAQLNRPVKEALMSMQLLDALWEMLPDEFDQPLLETWHEDDEAILCVRVNHTNGSFLGASSPIMDGTSQFIGAESPRHPASWYSPKGDEVMLDLLHG